MLLLQTSYIVAIYTYVYLQGLFPDHEGCSLVEVILIPLFTFELVISLSHRCMHIPLLWVFGTHTGLPVHITPPGNLTT